jgi:hypothetical protein
MYAGATFAFASSFEYYHVIIALAFTEIGVFYAAYEYPSQTKHPKTD